MSEPASVVLGRGAQAETRGPISHRTLTSRFPGRARQAAPLLLLLLALPAFAQGYAPARQGTDPLDAAREERVMKLGKVLRCAVCQGVAISDSPASMARAQLDKVRELVAQDKSDDEILEYFVARYGEWVLLEPRKEGLNAVLWLAPLSTVLIGFIVIVAQTRRAPVAAAPQTAATTDDFVAQVRKDLES